MPKTFEQETLEIESARISADLSYQKERDRVYHLPLFSKAQMDEVKRNNDYLKGIFFVVGLFLGAVIMYASIHS